MKFDVVVGNPPYQENNEDNNRDNPIYPHFYDLAEKIARKYVLISPARFLFGVGQTSKQWNQKMLNDEHLKVIYFNQKSSEIFPNTDIKGGVAVLYRDADKSFGPIETFTNFEELNRIMHKVLSSEGFRNISDIIYVRSSYKFTNEFLQKHPELKGRVKTNEERSMGSNVFDRYPEVFFKNKMNEQQIQIYGRQNNKRIYKYINSEYINSAPNLYGWKVFVAKSSGSGILGEILSPPTIGAPAVGHTQTFISIGNFETEAEACALQKYLKTKFVRVMLGIKKVTQDNATKDTWTKVPLQNFSSESDINWSKSILEIDQQLYKKYHLEQSEIDFIENIAKSMN